MKSILWAIQPYWFYFIWKGKKTIEVRKKIAKDMSGKQLFYVSKNKQSLNRIKFESEQEKAEFMRFVGKVVAGWKCSEVEEYRPCKEFYLYNWSCNSQSKVCLTDGGLWNYGNGNKLYGMHISDLKIYDKPKELGEFKTVKVVGRYHRKNETKFEKLQHSKRVEVKYITRPPQSWQYCEELI